MVNKWSCNKFSVCKSKCIIMTVNEVDQEVNQWHFTCPWFQVCSWWYPGREKLSEHCEVCSIMPKFASWWRKWSSSLIRTVCSSVNVEGEDDLLVSANTLVCLISPFIIPGKAIIPMLPRSLSSQNCSVLSQIIICSAKGGSNVTSGVCLIVSKEIESSECIN